ncbi:PASTA domain-containing protein [Nonomuraea sp. NPDC050478]|uniref:PASTA domain-containing protein n=1 Tax=Nonomuraea sp. NPDC050478 TaxID=3364365 RepID=UPI0037AFE534
MIKQSPKAGKRLRVGQQITLVTGYTVGDYPSSTDYGEGDVPNCPGWIFLGPGNTVSRV